MSPELPFRLVLGVGFLATLVITLHHRLRSWASKTPLDRRQEGRFILFTLRPAGGLLWLGVIAYLLQPAWMAWSSMLLPPWVRWSGGGFLIAGLGLLTWTLTALGTNLTDTVVTKREHALITHGPYRWVRHPFYDTMSLLVVAFALLAANWFILIAGAVVFTLLAVRARTEEAHLLARFGEPYRQYRKRTGRFLPKLSRP